MKQPNRGFTLIELLVVIAIIAVLAVVVVLVLNPAALLQQSRDSNRMSDMSTLTTALTLYNEDQGGSAGYSLGTPGIIYVSIPDPTATTTAGTNCSGLGLSPTGYRCPASSTYRNVNGMGWIPINFTSSTIGSTLGSLPVDPVNTTSSGQYYEYTTNGTSFEVRSEPESQKYIPLGGVSFSNGSSQSLLGAFGVTFTSSTYTVGSHPYAVAFDSHTNSIWVSYGNLGGTVIQINDTTYATSTYAVGFHPTAVAFDSHTNSIWVGNYNGGSVTQTNDTTYASSTYTVGVGVTAVAFDSHTDSIWVANYLNNTVTQINDTTYATSTYAVGSEPYAVAFDSHTNTIWVVNYNDNTVTQISPSR
jgi:prepilin-type N-terminal cleavage/methylation domain-containing protein